MDAILGYTPDANEDFYKILGCDELSTCEQIMVEYRVKAVEQHPDKNPDDPAAVENFQRLLRAKDILTDQTLRADYDLWRRSGIALSYEEWAKRRDSLKPSMHWYVRAKKEPMIEAPPAQEEPRLPADPEGPSSQNADFYSERQPKTFWAREEGSDTVRKFRDYQI